MGEADRVEFLTRDPDNLLDGKPVPAMTTMLHRVCGSDNVKFEEAMRLVRLFVERALIERKP